MMNKVSAKIRAGMEKCAGAAKDFFYALYVRMPSLPKKSTGGMRSKRVKDAVFFWGFAAIPLLALIFNLVFINLNSVLLAFRSYADTGEAGWSGLQNFAEVFRSYKSDPYMESSLKNSLVVYAVSVIVTAVIPIFFSYYLYKKKWGTELFKVVLFLPSVISGMATVIIFKCLTERVLPTVLNKIGVNIGLGLLSEPKTQFPTVLFYTLWMQLGGGMLVFLGAMNSVDKSVVEAGKLDGLGFVGELWHVVLPRSYTVISVGFITGIASIFTNDFGLYAFYGENASSRVSTLGYYFLVQTKRAEVTDYPFWAAWGLIASFIVIPLTFLARHVIYKYGPSED